MVVDAVFSSRGDLYAYLKTSEWVHRVQSLEPVLVVEALKRSGTVVWSAEDGGG